MRQSPKVFEIQQAAMSFARDRLLEFLVCGIVLGQQDLDLVVLGLHLGGMGNQRRLHSLHDARPKYQGHEAELAQSLPATGVQLMKGACVNEGREATNDKRHGRKGSNVRDGERSLKQAPDKLFLARLAGKPLQSRTAVERRRSSVRASCVALRSFSPAAAFFGFR
jgi:hypothetical protein